MSHGARVIRTGVSSGGPAAPPAAAASSSAGSDAELMDGAYFRSCAGMLKVAQMVRGERGGGRPLGPLPGPLPGPLGPSARAGAAVTPAGCYFWRRLWRASSGGAGVAAHRPFDCCDFTPRLSQLVGRRKVRVPLVKRSVRVCQKLPLPLPMAATRTSLQPDVCEPGVTLLARSTARHYLD